VVTKIRIAVRVKDEPKRRLYTVDDVGLTVDEMRAAALAEIPTATIILVEVPQPAPVLVLESA
jgi:hypothetical protein